MTSSVAFISIELVQRWGLLTDTPLIAWYHVECCENPGDAITREKQIKGWSRRKKTALIESANPGLADLAANWFEDASAVPYRDAKDSSLRSE